MKRKILVASLLLVTGILMACGNISKDQKTQSEEISKESETVTEESENTMEEQGSAEESNVTDVIGNDLNSAEHEEYRVGDTIRFVSGLEMTIIDSGLYTKPDLFDSTAVDTYAFLELDMENTGKDDISMTGGFFKFYADGYALRNAWLGEDGELPLNSNLSPGRKVKGRVYAEGPEINSAKHIEAEFGNALIRIYEDGDYGIDVWDTEDEDLTIDECLGALFSIYGGDEQVSLYMDGAGNLCVWYGYGGADEAFYEQTYDSYKIEDHVLYGYAGDVVDIFDFWEDGIAEGQVEVLLDGYGSNHYQTYIQEEEYFSTDWKKAFGRE